MAESYTNNELNQKVPVQQGQVKNTFNSVTPEQLKKVFKYLDESLIDNYTNYEDTRDLYFLGAADEAIRVRKLIKALLREETE